MAQTLRDWYRYLERQMHVSLPEPLSPVDAGPPDALAAVSRQIGAVMPGGSRPATMKAQPASVNPVAISAAIAAQGVSGRTAGAAGGGQAPRAALEAEARADAVRRSLGAGPDQPTLPMELGPRGRGRGGRRPITESREEIIRRLLDPEISLHEAAAVLNLSKATVRRYTDQGKLACLRTEGGQRRFRLSALLGFLDVQSQARGETAG
ncbi:MAG: helix-turn-helix domain-containing protein [bacterium]